VLHLLQPATFSWTLGLVHGGGGGGGAVDKTICLLLFNYVALEPTRASTLSVNVEAREIKLIADAVCVILLAILCIKCLTVCIFVCWVKPL
jgi:hypothetical protein